MSATDELKMFGETAEDRWEYDVWLMARRTALLYHYMAKAVIERLGREEGHKLIKEAIMEYGVHCGDATREALAAQGLPATLENFGKVPDLPSRGWRWQRMELSDGTAGTGVTLCPLARVWEDVGTDPATARLYCFVDQAKIKGYNDAAYECVHARNVLDGDTHCEVVFRPKSS